MIEAKDIRIEMLSSNQLLDNTVIKNVLYKEYDVYFSHINLKAIMRFSLSDP